jgi:hypothetical protein
MGCFDIYGTKHIQIKAGERKFNVYHIGDKTKLKDGIYIGYEGVIAVNKHIVVAEFDHVIDKWGNKLNCHDIISVRNPINSAIKRYEKKMVKKKKL